MELGVTRLKDMIELAQLRWLGHVTKRGISDTRKWRGKLKRRERAANEDAD